MQVYSTIQCQYEQIATSRVEKIPYTHACLQHYPMSKQTGTNLQNREGTLRHACV